jgi:hypothetical protein
MVLFCFVRHKVQNPSLLQVTTASNLFPNGSCAIVRGVYLYLTQVKAKYWLCGRCRRFGCYICPCVFGSRNT